MRGHEEHNTDDFLSSGPGRWYLKCVHFSLPRHSLHLSSAVCSTGLSTPSASFCPHLTTATTPHYWSLNHIMLRADCW